MNTPRYVSPRKELNVHSWAWKDEPEDDPVILTQRKFPQVALTEDNRNVLFHWGWSGGTSAVRGDQPFTSGNNYYWEIEIDTALYGTDVMIGVGTADVRLSMIDVYVSLLGLNNDSWGLSYTGKFHHGGSVFEDKAMQFGSGDCVGVHLDMWYGTLAFFVNGTPVCVINDISLKKHTLYPMVCSTSASTSLRVIYSYSSNKILENMCLETLESDTRGMSVVSKIPGLSKEFVKRFLKTKYGTQMSKEHCYSIEVDLDILTDGEAESSEGEIEISIAELR